MTTLFTLHNTDHFSRYQALMRLARGFQDHDKTCHILIENPQPTPALQNLRQFCSVNGISLLVESRAIRYSEIDCVIALGKNALQSLINAQAAGVSRRLLWIDSLKDSHNRLFSFSAVVDHSSALLFTHSQIKDLFIAQERILTPCPIVAYPVDMPLKHDLKNERTTLRHLLNLAPQTVCIGSLITELQHTEVLTLIDLAREILTQRRYVQFYILMNDNISAAYRKTVQKIIEHSQLAYYVHLVNYSAQFLSVLDMTIVSSTLNGDVDYTIDSLQTSQPVIGYNTIANRISLPSAQLFNDFESLKQATIALIDNRKQRQQMVLAARQRLKQQSVAACLSQLFQIMS